MAVFFCFSCGGGSSSSSKTPTSKIAKRAFVSNQISSILEIVDAAKDTLSTFTISAGSGPTLMVESQDKKLTLVFADFSNGLAVIDNSTESVKNSFSLRDTTESFAISSDDRFIYVAERSVVPSGATLAGAVEIFDLNNASTASTLVSVPGARSLALSHNGSTLLVFSDDPTVVSAAPNNTKVFFIDTTNTSAGAKPLPGFDRPVFAVFTSDDSTAYVLNCGGECGGTTAGVAAVSVASQSIAATTGVLVPARTALLNGGTLYVAGTVPGNPASGTLSVINTATLGVMARAGISDGIHDRIALGSNGKLFVGARACSNTSATGGCLAIYDTTTNPATAVIHPPYAGPSGAPLPGDITGIEPIPGRNVVYVCEGGELNIYDTTTSGLSKGATIDIVGKAVDVKEVF